jgi:hypothetical protein
MATHSMVHYIWASQERMDRRHNPTTLEYIHLHLTRYVAKTQETSFRCRYCSVVYGHVIEDLVISMGSSCGCIFDSFNRHRYFHGHDELAHL